MLNLNYYVSTQEKGVFYLSRFPVFEFCAQISVLYQQITVCDPQQYIYMTNDPKRKIFDSRHR